MWVSETAEAATFDQLIAALTAALATGAHIVAIVDRPYYNPTGWRLCLYTWRDDPPEPHQGP